MAKSKKKFHEMQRKKIERLAKNAPIRLRIAREAAGHSQADLARELGITRGRWSQYEKGQRLLNWEIAGHVAVICKVDANYILFGYDFDLERDVRGRIKMTEDKLRYEGSLPTDGLHRWLARRG